MLGDAAAGSRLRVMAGCRLRRWIAGSAALVAALTVAGCDGRWGLVDDSSSARLVNDLHAPVRLRLCSDNVCEHFAPPDEMLDPGSEWPVNVSSVGVPNVYGVFGAGGAKYGCLPLVTPYHRTEIRVRVSEHVPCRSAIDESRFWPDRWEAVEG